MWISSLKRRGIPLIHLGKGKVKALNKGLAVIMVGVICAFGGATLTTLVGLGGLGFVPGLVAGFWPAMAVVQEIDKYYSSEVV